MSYFNGGRSGRNSRSKFTPPHLSAGVPRVLLFGAVFPSAAIATAMHYSADVRERVNNVVPGSTDALSKLTGTNYNEGRTKNQALETTPATNTSSSEYEGIPELMTRIAKRNDLNTSKPSSPVDQSYTEFKGVDTTHNESQRRRQYAHRQNQDDPSLKHSPGDLRSPDSPVPEASRTIELERKATVSTSAPKDFASTNQVSLDGPMTTSSSGEKTFKSTPSIEYRSQTELRRTSETNSEPQACVKGDSKQIGRSDSYQSDPKSGAKSSSSPAGARDEAVSDKPDQREDVKSIKEKFALVFGRKEIDEGLDDGRDVVDTSVYQKPNALAWNLNFAKKSNANTQASHADSVQTVTKSEKEVAALRAELESQAKWDAVRMQEAIRAQIVADKKAAAAEAAAIAKTHQHELENVRREAMQEAHRFLEAKTKELEDNMIKRRNEEVKQELSVREKELEESLEKKYMDKELLNSEERNGELMAIRATVSGLQEHLVQIRDCWNASKSASGLAASAFSLRDVIEGNQSFDKELLAAAQKNDLGKLIADTIPQDICSRGVATLDELRSSFSVVAREGLKAALVPGEEVGNMWSHMLAAVVSRLKVSVDESPTFRSGVVVRTDEDRIRRAERSLSRGDLWQAVQSLQGLSPLPASIMSDWVSEANARISANLAARALLADAIVSQHTLSSSQPSTLEA